MEHLGDQEASLTLHEEEMCIERVQLGGVEQTRLRCGFRA